MAKKKVMKQRTFMPKKEKSECIEELRQWLVKWTKCSVQNGGWPCGTCACYLISRLGAKETGQHNKPIDRVNEVWRAILQIRGDYEDVKV
jgi:hypothetical protein